IIFDKYDKLKIPMLPRVLFEGSVEVIDDISKVDKAVDYLLKESILGFDTETRPSFKKGKMNKVSLLQVSTHNICYLFRLNMLGLPLGLIRFLEDKSVPKIGLSLHDDMLSLLRRGKFTPGNFIDLQRLVGEIGVKDLSLQKLYANFFSQKISKAMRLSNWENKVLEERQKYYAATDAWACIMIYEELLRLKSTGDYELIKSPEVTPQTKMDFNQEA
ncbi:MAG: 3'-5' exonuclease domain-containing protein 2, partial [Prevotella sp.]|nr:3'-5' exonuclease domain-containing protein 2 [Prevotella sp.]